MTRSRCRWRRWSQRAGRPSRSCPDAGWATPAARSTSWSRFPAGARRCRTPTSCGSSTTSARSCARPATSSRRPTASSTRCATSPRTVESIPLIASSIMSKKIAEGSHALVLDVKVGSGAFMKTSSRRANSPRRWSSWARRTACSTVALLTGMDVPLGRTAGNALEVAESVEVLAGGGPRRRRRADPGLGARDAGGGRHRHRSGRRARGRPRDGRVAAR